MHNSHALIYFQEELPKFGRSYKSFSDATFEKELDKINWDILLEGKDADSRIQLILTKTTEILDKLAPIRKLTKREANLSQVPWLTRGILKSMNSRDNLHKKYLKEKKIILTRRVSGRLDRVILRQTLSPTGSVGG